MSIAASISQLEASTTEQVVDIANEEEAREATVLEKFTAVSPPIIAVDFDDVLSRTNEIVAEWHNTRFGTTMSISSFYYYYYWKNPYWGTMKETFDKVKEFYSTDTIFRVQPVPGALEGIACLREMGYKLIIVTARTQDNKDQSWNWVNQHFPGLFDSLICTGQFRDAQKVGHEVSTRLNKAQVCHDLGARLLIDDSAENALQCATWGTPTPSLLFGEYEWNKRVCDSNDPRNGMSFDQRLEAEGGREFWKDDKLEIPEGAPLHRVKNWVEVVEWVRCAREEGRL